MPRELMPLLDVVFAIVSTTPFQSVRDRQRPNDRQQHRKAERQH